MLVPGFLELILVTYLNLLEYVLNNDDNDMGHSPYLVCLKLITHNHANESAQQEIVWLENVWSLNTNNNEYVDDANVTTHMNIIGGIENLSADTEDFFLKTLSAVRFHEIRDRMLGEHSHIDMLNATGTKKAEACRLDPS